MTETRAEARPGSRLAVLGSPIAHSKSPLLHAAAYRALGLDWAYEAHRVDETGLAAFVESRDDAWRGLSLTMPLKHAIAPLLHDVDLVARSTGAVNTVLFDRAGGGLVRRGFNTDVAGIVRALGAEGVGSARHVEVFGGGATAASAVAAAAELGAESVTVTVRTPAKAQALVEVGRTLGTTVRIRSFAELSTGAGTADAPELVISTLPGGTEAPVVVPAALRRASVLFDVAYDPWPSALAAEWTAEGGRVISGLAMLVQQALVQVRIFTAGDPTTPLPDEERVLAAMFAAVRPDAGAAVASTGAVSES